MGFQPSKTQDLQLHTVSDFYVLYFNYSERLHTQFQVHRTNTTEIVTEIVKLINPLILVGSVQIKSYYHNICSERLHTKFQFQSMAKLKTSLKLFIDDKQN